MTSTFSPDTFQGQRIMITGAAGGLGAECARTFHALGAELILVDLEDAKLTDVERSLTGSSSVTSVATNLTNTEHRAELVRKVCELGGVDHLVLAAGIYRRRPVVEMSDADIDETLHVNLRSPVQLIRDIDAQLHDNGSIVLFSSMAGERGSRHHAHYAATKGALTSLGRSLSWELSPRNIRVNSVAPGIIRTSMTDELVAQNSDHLLASTPLGRFGEPEEVVGAVIFLCSDAASFVTGVSLQVNGGLHMA